MTETHAVVLSGLPQTKRQIARTLQSGAIAAEFLDSVDEFLDAVARTKPDLVMLDADARGAGELESILDKISQRSIGTRVIIVSVEEDKSELIRLLEKHDVGNLIAKHGAIRAAYPMLDEHELLVTCEKVLRGDIFGIEKYVGLWGVMIHETILTSLAEKGEFLQRFEKYLEGLACPSGVIPGIVTVADELILNAVVHAPHDAEGKPRYEHLGPSAPIVLEPHEYVRVTYGCDGQRLMLSVHDSFGRLNRSTLYRYLAGAFQSERRAPESKASGAGLGLSMSFQYLHQLIFNVHESRRTEVIAGWYVRGTRASEFRQVGKSLNVFWLSQDARPAARKPRLVRDALGSPPSAASEGQIQVVGAAAYSISGRIDENLDFEQLSKANMIDLGQVTGISSRGVLNWIEFVKSRSAHTLAVRAVPEEIIRQAAAVVGVLDGVRVESVRAMYECSTCHHEQLFEVVPAELRSPPDEPCESCGGVLSLVDDPCYEMLSSQLHSSESPIPPTPAEPPRKAPDRRPAPQSSSRPPASHPVGLSSGGAAVSPSWAANNPMTMALAFMAFGIAVGALAMWFVGAFG